MSIRNSFAHLGDLNDFAPKPPAATPPNAGNAPGPAAPTPAQLERVAAAEGFAVDNLPVERRALKSGRVAARERAQPMTLRLRVGDWNRFSAFCERNGYTVAEGFEQLVSFADRL